MTVIDKLAWLHMRDKRVPRQSDHASLIREIREELSVVLLPEAIRLVRAFEDQAHGQPDRTSIRMRCHDAAYRGQILGAAAIEEALWLSSGDAGQCSAMVQQVLAWLREQGHIE